MHEISKLPYLVNVSLRIRFAWVFMYIAARSCLKYACLTIYFRNHKIKELVTRAG